MFQEQRKAWWQAEERRRTGGRGGWDTLNQYATYAAARSTAVNGLEWTQHQLKRYKPVERDNMVGWEVRHDDLRASTCCPSCCAPAEGGKIGCAVGEGLCQGSADNHSSHRESIPNWLAQGDDVWDYAMQLHHLTSLSFELQTSRTQMSARFELASSMLSCMKTILMWMKSLQFPANTKAL